MWVRLARIMRGSEGMAKQCNTVDFSRRETAEQRSGVTKQGEGNGQPEGRLQRLGGLVGERGKKKKALA